MGGWSQLFFFFFLFVTGYVLAVLTILAFINVQSLEHSLSSMRLTMVIQSVCLFLLPALAFIYFCQNNPQDYLYSTPKQSFLFCFLAIFLIVVIQPLVSSISYYNQQLVLPESFSFLEDWMRTSEDNAEKSLTFLLSDKSISSLLLNILVLAFVAGITEEIFFRGCMQQIFEKITSNRHLAVWITAFIFSAIHFQFYGFSPRLLLGALLGYLFIWGGNIVIPIVVHICHNAIAVIFSHLYIGTSTYEQIDKLDIEKNSLLILSSLILTSLTLCFLYRKRTREMEI